MMNMNEEFDDEVVENRVGAFHMTYYYNIVHCDNKVSYFDVHMSSKLVN